MTAKQYLFGYGSLLNTKSRERTAKTGPAVPGSVRGLKRAWNVFSQNSGTVFLGLVESDGECPGAFYEVDEQAMALFDEREMSYSRVQLSQSRIGADLPEGAIIWTYIPEPQVTIPLKGLQASKGYLEVVRAGSQEVGIGWESLLESTLGWEHATEAMEKLETEPLARINQ